MASPQPADTTVVVVLTSTSIVIPSSPPSDSPTPTPDPNGNPGVQSSPASPLTTVTTILITSESTIEVTPTASPFPSSSSNADSSSTHSPTITGHTQSNDHNSNGISTSTKIAIGVAVPCGVLAILAIVGFFFWSRRQHSKAIRNKRLAEIRDYSYNPNLDGDDAALTGARRMGSPKERPDSMATLQGGPAPGNGKSSSDDPTVGNYRGWGPSPEAAAAAGNLNGNIQTTPNLLNPTATPSSLIPIATAVGTTPSPPGSNLDDSLVMPTTTRTPSTPQMTQLYTPPAGPSPQQPLAAAQRKPERISTLDTPLSPDQTLSPTSPVMTPYSPLYSNYQYAQYDLNQHPIAPYTAGGGAISTQSNGYMDHILPQQQQNTQHNIQSPMATAITSDRAINSMNSANQLQPSRFNQNYSDMYYSAPEEARRVASNF